MLSLLRLLKDLLVAIDYSLKGADTVLKAGVVCLLRVWVKYDWVVQTPGGLERFL